MGSGRRSRFKVWIDHLTSLRLPLQKEEVPAREKWCYVCFNQLLPELSAGWACCLSSQAGTCPRCPSMQHIPPRFKGSGFCLSFSRWFLFQPRSTSRLFLVSAMVRLLLYPTRFRCNRYPAVANAQDRRFQFAVQTAKDYFQVAVFEDLSAPKAAAARDARLPKALDYLEICNSLGKAADCRLQFLPPSPPPTHPRHKRSLASHRVTVLCAPRGLSRVESTAGAQFKQLKQLHLLQVEGF